MKASFAGFLAGFSLAFPAAAQPVTMTKEVVVTATRFSEPQQELPVGVTVITKEQIRDSTAATVPELLKQFPGIHVRDLTGSPNLQVDMRGFGIFGDQNTLVLLDGQRISENEQSAVNWSAIPLAAIERIEIMRGSGAVLYGGGATGGTINIITRGPQANQKDASVYAAAGSYAMSEGRIGANLGADRVGLRFDASQIDTDNYRANNALRQKNAQADVRYAAERGSVSLKFGADDQSLQLPGSLSEAQIQANRRAAATPLDFSTLRSGYANLGAETQLAAGDLAANLGYREKHSFGAFFVGTPFRNNISTDVRVLSFTPRARLPYTLGGFNQKLVVGLDWDDWNFASGSGPSIVGRPFAFQRDTAGYVQNTTLLSEATTLSLGGRLHNVDYGVNDAANPGATGERSRNLRAYEVAARHRLNTELALYGKFGNSFRVPNVNDNFNLFTATVTLLEPQTSHDREIGVEYQAGAAQYRAALYLMDVNNEIHLDPVTFNNTNLPPTRRYGLELEGKWRISSAISAFANYTYAVAKFREGAFGGVSVVDKDVPLVPHSSANAGVAWEFAPRTQLNAVINYIGEQIYDGDETNTFGRKMPGYTVVDLKLTTERAGWLVSAEVKNLFNEKYYSYGVFTGFPTFAAIPAPERSLFASAQYTFR